MIGKYYTYICVNELFDLAKQEYFWYRVPQDLKNKMVADKTNWETLLKTVSDTFKSSYPKWAFA